MTRKVIVIRGLIECGLSSSDCVRDINKKIKHES